MQNEHVCTVRYIYINRTIACVQGSIFHRGCWGLTPALVFEPPPDPHIGLRSRIRHELLSPALVFKQIEPCLCMQ